MSDKIDQRIVEMSFENHKFEKGILESKNSLKEFNDAIKKTAGNDFNGLEKSVGTVSQSFSAFEQIGVGALRRIGEAAVDAGTKVLKNLTVDQLAAGWDKYEQKTASVQTIMNATGKSISEVNGYLDKLMWFSDETSYGFTDMTAALAQMTSSGGDIEKLIPMITGVANATAFAGKGAAEFSRAMFNLNQSYGAGSLKLMDWRSLELAGVAGKQLKQILIETGKEVGTLNAAGETAKGNLVDIGTFSNTLQDSWANTEVMEKAFGKFSELSEAAYELVQSGQYDTAAQAMDALSGQYSKIAEDAFRAAQTAKSFSEAISATMDAVSSGWMRTYELIFGDLDEAKEKFTALTEILWIMFASGAEERNEMLAWLKEMGGIDNVFQGAKNAAIALLKILKPIAAAFEEIFPPKTKEQWLAITEAFKNFTESLIISEETADKVKRTFAGLFAVIDIILDVVKFLGQAAFELVKVFLPLGDGVLSASASLGDFLVNLRNAIKSSQALQYALLAVKVGTALLRQGIASAVSVISEFISGLWNAEHPLEYLKEAGKKTFGNIVEAIKMAIDWLSGKFKKAVNGIKGIFDGVFDSSDTGVWPTLLRLLKEAVEFIGGNATEAFKNFGESVNKIDFHKIATFVVGGVLLIFVKQLSDLTGALTGFTNAATGAIKGLTNKFLGYKTTTNIRDMAYALGVLAASIWVLSKIPAVDLQKSLIGLAAALGTFVVAYGLLIGIQVAASKLMKNTEMISSGFGLVGVAASLVVLSVALKTISKIDEESVWRSYGVLTAMMGLIVAYQALAALISKIPGQNTVELKLFGLSASILALSGALAILSLFSMQQLASGLAKMATLLTLLGAIQILFGVAARIGGGNKLSANILSMALGLAAMVGVMALLGAISSKTITKGIGNLALLTSLLAAVQIFMGIGARIGGGNKVSANMLQIALGLGAMVAVIALLKEMPQSDIDKGLSALGSMVVLIGAIEILTATSARIAQGAKVQKILGSVTVTMLSFVGVIAIISAISQENINKGLLTLTAMTGLILGIEVLTALISKINPDAKAFGALAGVSVAIVALTGSLALLSMVDQASLRTAAESLAIASVAIIALSVAMRNISAAIDVISRSSQGFGTKVKNIGLTLVALGALLLATMAFFGTLAVVLPVIEKTSWTSLAKFTVGIVAITALIVALDRIPMSDGGFAQRLLGLIPGFAAMAAVLLGTMGFFGALALVLPIVDNVSWESLGKFTLGLALISGLLIGLSALSPVFAAVSAIAGPMLLGVATALAGVAGIVLAVTGLAALMNVMISDESALLRGLDLLVAVGGGIGRFVGAIVGGVAGGVLESIGVSLAAFAESLSGFSPESLEGIKALSEAILILTGSAILDGLASLLNFGQSPMESFANQMKDFIVVMTEISKDDASSASSVLAAMTPMAENLKVFAEAAKDIPNSGGFIGAFMGNNDIDTFGQMLANLISAFSNVSLDSANKATAIVGALEPMANNLQALARAADSIPNTGGFIGDFMGNNDIDVFGGQLVGFMQAFNGITVDQATTASNVLNAMSPMAGNLKSFANAAQDIPSSGGFIDVFLGSVDLPTFSGQIAGLVDLFGDLDKTKIQTSTQALNLMTDQMLPSLEKFSEFSNGLKASGGIAQLFTGNTTLSEFGTELQKFITTVGSVDFSIVQPAIDGINNVTLAFKEMGDTSLSAGLESFNKDKKAFQDAITTILDTPIEELKKKKKKLTDEIVDVFKSVTDKASSYKSQFKTLGGDIVSGLTSGIQGKRSGAISAITSLMNGVVNAAKNTVDSHSPSKVFEEIGGWCDKGLANGLSKQAQVAVKAGISMASQTEEGVRDTLGVHSLSEKFADIGSWLPTSIGSGIQNGKQGLLDAAASLGIDTGNLTVDGITNALSGGQGKLTSGIDALIEALSGTGSSSPTAAAEGTGTSLGNSITSGLNSALSNSKSGLGGSSTQATVKSELDKLKSVIEERSFYGQISIEEELALYQKLRNSYKEGSDERKQIDREIYTRMKTIYESQLAYIEGVREAQADAAKERAELTEKYGQDVSKAETEASKKLADLKKKYNDDVNKANLDATKKVQSQEKSYYNDLNSILDNAEKERQSTREQYAANQKSINEKLLSDIDAQNKAYEDAVKSRADAIYSSYNIFAAVEEDEVVTGDELLQNLRDQGAALSEWKQSLDALAARGVGDTMIEELQAMGPSSKAQIKALLTLTDDQLTEYVNLFAGKYAFARTKAEEELEGLKDSTTQTIKDLNAQAAIDLDALASEYAASMSDINDKMAADMEELRTTHNEALAEIQSDLDEKLYDLKSTWEDSNNEVRENLATTLSDLSSEYNSSMEKINSELKDKLDELKKTYSSSMKEVKDKTTDELKKLIAENKTQLSQLNLDTTGKLDEVKKTVDTKGSAIATSWGGTMKGLVGTAASNLGNVVSTIRSKLSEATPAFNSAGYNATAGFANGMINGGFMASNAGRYIANLAISAATNTLNEHSPSKVFEGIGQFVSQGFANGITEYADKAKKASEDMANGPIAAVSQALVDFEDSDDLSFTITPVLDLSNLRANDLSQLLDTPVQLGSVSSKLASEVVQNGSKSQEPTTTIINKFDLTGLTVREDADVDAIANKLYQKQLAAQRGRGIRTVPSRS